MLSRQLASLAVAALAACSPTLERANPDPIETPGDASTPVSDASAPTEADVAVDAAPIPIGPAGDFSKSVTIDGVARTYVLHVPTTAVAAMQMGPVPILVGFHGAGDTANNFVTAAGLKDIADSNGFVLLGPDAYDAGGGAAWFLLASEGWAGADGSPTSSLRNDLHLVLRILKDTAAAYHVDAKRTYACGFSRGAGFTALWALTSDNAQFAQLSGLATVESPFAAYGISAGFDAFGGKIDPSMSSPKRPVWIMHGTADQAVPFAQGQGLAQSLEAGGWAVTFTPVTDAPHDWLWRASYQHGDQELWNWFLANPMP